MSEKNRSPSGSHEGSNTADLRPWTNVPGRVWSKLYRVLLSLLVGTHGSVQPESNVVRDFYA